MSLVTGFVVYFITWFLVLFMVLPWGVRSQEDDGAVEPGTVASAPVNPAIWQKLLITSIVAGVFFGLFWASVEYELIDYRAIVQDLGPATKR